MKYLDVLEGNRAGGNAGRPAVRLAGRNKVRKQSRIKMLIMAVVVMTAADILLTAVGLRNGYLVELNPMMLFILDSKLMIYLLIPALLVCFAVLYYYSEAVRWLGGVMTAIAVVKALILVQHFVILARVFGP